MTSGVTLKTYRKREGISQAELGRIIAGVPRMEHDERTIGKAMAKKLAGAFNFDYRVLL